MADYKKCKCGCPDLILTRNFTDTIKIYSQSQLGMSTQAAEEEIADDPSGLSLTSWSLNCSSCGAFIMKAGW